MFENPLLLMILVLAIVVMAAYYYFQRAKARDVAVPPADDTNTRPPR